MYSCTLYTKSKLSTYVQLSPAYCASENAYIPAFCCLSHFRKEKEGIFPHRIISLRMRKQATWFCGKSREFQ